MKFKYKAYGDILRPVISVQLIYKDRVTDYEVLVNSGADCCFFDAEIGEDIGIYRGNNEINTVFSVGGKVSLYYFHPVTIKIGDFSFDIESGFLPSSVGGKIVPYGIVGQKGFFDKFTVKFDYARQEVELKIKK